MCREGCYSFSLITPYPWSVPYNAELSKEASSTFFRAFGMTQPGIQPSSPGTLVNTLTIIPMHRWLPQAYIHTYIHTHTHIYIHIYIYIYICVCVYIYIYINKRKWVNNYLNWEYIRRILYFFSRYIFSPISFWSFPMVLMVFSRVHYMTAIWRGWLLVTAVSWNKFIIAKWGSFDFFFQWYSIVLA